MDKNILLSIAIPTFNGGGTIERTLESILPQLRPEVDVLICDNASTDSTATIVSKFVVKNPGIRYFRNESNVGFDRNVDLCLQRAIGKYVWILSDDDIICSVDAISKIISVIIQYPELGAIYIDSRHPIKLDPMETGLCKDGNEFFRKNRFKCGLVSSNIFSKSAWQQICVNRYFDSGWIHMGFLIEVLNQYPSYAICEELIAQLVLEEGKGVMRWGGTGSFLRTGLRLVEIYQNMPNQGYSPNIVRAAYQSIRGGYLKYIPLAKAKGLRVNMSLVKEFINLYSTFPSFWLIHLPLLLLPGFIFRWARAILHSFRHFEGAHGN